MGYSSRGARAAGPPSRSDSSSSSPSPVSSPPRARSSVRRLALVVGLALLVEVVAEVVGELLDRLVERLLRLVGPVAARRSSRACRRPRSAARSTQLRVELGDAVDVDAVEVAVRRGVDHGDLLGDRHRLALALVERLRRAARRGPACAACPRRGRSRTGRTPRGRGTARARSSGLPATFFIGAICALPPTRDTEMPTLMAGRTPE